jgi:hypothetical protein
LIGGFETFENGRGSWKMWPINTEPHTQFHLGFQHNRTPAAAILKGPKHEIFESEFFTQIIPVWLGDLGTSEKKLKFRKFESWYEDFCWEYLMKRMISMLLITKKFQDRQKTKFVWDALGTLMKCSRKFFYLIFVFQIFYGGLKKRIILNAGWA